MPAKKKMRPEVKRWLSLAKDDLKSAKANLSAKVFYISAFLSQQSVEKALKAVLISKTRKLIKTHDLVLLGRHVGLPKQLIKSCETLNTVYIESRYGDTGDLPSKKFGRKIASELLEIAKEVLQWSEKSI
jgi:HEPN domain-containing protein